jgi:hypothetical protein
MPIDIRDYLPPSLKHVLVYTSRAEREKREQAARDGFGHPTPVPPASAEPGDEDPTLQKTPPASPWSAKETSSVDREALPSALMPPPAAAEPRERPTPQAAPARKTAPRHVALAVLCALVVAGLAIGMPARWLQRKIEAERAIAMAEAIAMAKAGTSATAISSAAPAPSTTVSAAPVAPSGTATAAPSGTATAAPSAKARTTGARDDPYDDTSNRPPPTKIINEDKPVF